VLIGTEVLPALFEIKMLHGKEMKNAEVITPAFYLNLLPVPPCATAKAKAHAGLGGWGINPSSPQYNN
jgi:hypothetical protein